MTYPWKESFESLDDALTRLEEILAMPIDDRRVVCDATIKRFEFSFELFWKTLKRFLYIDGIETKSPRETLKMAYQLNWTDNEELWLNMLRDRNESSHIYDEDKAYKIYENIQGYCLAMRKVHTQLAKKIDTPTDPTRKS